MPAAISHYLLARRVLDDPAFDKSRSFSQMLFMGRSRSRLLFYSPVFPLAEGRKLKEIGERLHQTRLEHF